MEKSISQLLEDILTAVYGKDVRKSIHDAILKSYEDATKGGNANMEVSQARGIYTSLSERLAADLSNTIERIDEGDSRLRTLIDSVVSGSPLVASSVSGMTDTTRVYVNITDGKWYYYNGTAWTVGDVYQSTGIGEGSIGFKNLDDNLSNHLKVRNTVFTQTEGKYITVSGNISNLTNYAYSSPIQLLKGETILAKLAGYPIAMISTCDSNGESITPVVISTDNIQEKIVSYTATDDCYVILCSKFNTNPITIVSIYKNFALKFDVDNINYFIDKFKEIVDWHIPTFTQIDGKYINSYGLIASLVPYAYSSPIQLLKGERIVAKLQGEVSSATVSLITLCDENGENRIPVVLAEDSNTKVVEYTATDNCYVILCSKVRVQPIDILGIVKIIQEQENQKNNITGLINKAVFIGDSLTYGATYVSDTSPRFYRNKYNYPYFMKKILQIDSIEEYARSGATATSWWDEFNENININNAVYFVWLGTNGEFTNTVESDCAGDDYTTYAETETGYMGKILGKISALSNVKIVLLNVFAANGHHDETNAILDKFVQKFNCIKVDIMSNKPEIQKTKYHTAYNGYYNSVHFNNAGHNLIANIVYDKVKEVIIAEPLKINLYEVHQ